MGVQEYGLSQEEAWGLSPQEWWDHWSYKWGKRRQVVEGRALAKDEFAQMAEELREHQRRESSG